MMGIPWVLPGYPLTYDLYTHGPDRRHWLWLAVVTAVVFWRGFAGRIPGCEGAALHQLLRCASAEPGLSRRLLHGSLD